MTKDLNKMALELYAEAIKQGLIIGYIEFYGGEIQPICGQRNVCIKINAELVSVGGK